MDWIERDLLEELPEGWEVTVQRTQGALTVQCRHVVLGGHEFHLDAPDGTPPEEAAEGHITTIVDRLAELGLLEASQLMPDLTAAETETLREAHAVIAAAELSKRQARSVVGLSQSLSHVSTEAADWAFSTLDLLEPWHEYPADAADTTSPAEPTEA